MAMGHAPVGAPDIPLSIIFDVGWDGLEAPLLRAPICEHLSSGPFVIVCVFIDVVKIVKLEFHNISQYHRWWASKSASLGADVRLFLPFASHNRAFAILILTFFQGHLSEWGNLRC